MQCGETSCRDGRPPLGWGGGALSIHNESLKHNKSGSSWVPLLSRPPPACAGTTPASGPPPSWPAHGSPASPACPAPHGEDRPRCTLSCNTHKHNNVTPPLQMCLSPFLLRGALTIRRNVLQCSAVLSLPSTPWFASQQRPPPPFIM